MRSLALVALFAVSTCWAQEPATNPPQQPASQTETAAPAVAQNKTIVIPLGTRIPLALASPISAKSRRGDVVRAITGFPVTVGAQLAIPVNTYVEGVIDKVSRGGRSGPTLQMHFTRLLYSTGYTVPVDGTNAQASARAPKSDSPNSDAPQSAATFTDENVAGNALAGQQQPTLPPLKNPGPSMGAVVGLAVGGAAATIAVIFLSHRHAGGGYNGTLFDTGWQFELVLQAPLAVDAASVAAAVNDSSAQ